MRIENLFPIAQDLAIVFPDGEETGITFSVITQDSKAFREVAKRYASQFMGSEVKPSLDVLELQNVELSVACIVGWSGIEGADGAAVPYTREKAQELLAQPELTFIREQVENFISKRARFFRKHQTPA